MAYYTYILTDQFNKTLYVGVTGDLSRRITEHKEELSNGFTQKYHVHKLVYFEEYSDPKQAIAREKQLKGWNRAKKCTLITALNPRWEDLTKV